MLRNQDYSDRELLLVCIEQTQNQGAFTANDIAARLGVNATDTRSPGGRVAPRLSWMKRYGLLERLDPELLVKEDRKTVWWAVTDFGETVAHGRLPVGVAKKIDSGGMGDRILIMRSLADVGYVQGNNFEAAVLRREWLHTTSRRRNER